LDIRTVPYKARSPTRLPFIRFIIYSHCRSILATKIRSDSSLQGIQVKQNQIKITQLADGTTLYLKNEPEISKALNIMMNLAKYLA